MLVFCEALQRDFAAGPLASLAPARMVYKDLSHEPGRDPKKL
jgi:hypothetical protein